MTMRLFIAFFCFMASSSVFAQDKALNPDISINGLLLYRMGSEGNAAESEDGNGFSVQEIELRLTSNIDAYFRGDFTLAIEDEEGEFHVEPEEAFVETLSLPGATVRAGKFYAFWGRHNQLHTHYFPFIDAPLSADLLGEHGLNDVGAAVSALIPAPWYSEIVLQAFSGDNEHLFGSPSRDDVAGIYFLKNLWDLSDAATLELDLGYGNGRNVDNDINHIYNAALTLKWRPLEKSRYRSFSWTTEYTAVEKLLDEDGVDQGRTGALSSWIQYQTAQRWWLQARGEVLKSHDGETDDVKKYSALLGYVPTEYSALRLQYDSIDDPSADETEQRVTLQLNVSLGAHPAHLY